MDLGLPEIFSHYMTWLKSVLSNRRLDTSHTMDALQDLSSIIQELLAGEDKDNTIVIIEQAIKAYEQANENSLISLISSDQSISFEEKRFYEALVNNDRLTAWYTINTSMSQKRSYVDPESETSVVLI